MDVFFVHVLRIDKNNWQKIHVHYLKNSTVVANDYQAKQNKQG